MRELPVWERGDVLRVTRTFSNPDLLRRGDVVVVLSRGDDRCVTVLNLMRGSGDYGWSPDRFRRVGRNVAYALPASTRARLSPTPQES